MFVVFAISSFGQIVVNELCSKNHYNLLVDDEKSPDWFEIKNVADTSVSLSCYFVSDNSEDLQKSRLPNVVLEPNEIVLFLANGKENCDCEYHCVDFQLSSKGETIILSDENSKIIQYLDFPALKADHSFGLEANDFSQYMIFPLPTPDQENSGAAFQSYCKQPEVNFESGFYHEPLGLEFVHLSENEEVFYTLDGRDPGNDGLVYDCTLSLDSSCVVRAVSRGGECLESFELRKSYFFRESHGFPVVSLFAHPDSLWDEELGIFVMGPDADTVYPYYGANFWKQKRIQAHVQFFEEDGSLQFQKGFGMEVHGGSVTRTRDQKAVRLVADKYYGDEKLEYPLFPDKKNSIYHRFLLRNSGGDFNKLHFRDGFVHKLILQDSLNVDVLAFRPAVVYLNGTYWGIMNIREKVDKYYLCDNYCIDENSLDLLEEGGLVIDGDSDAFWDAYNFICSHDMRMSANFSDAKLLFDVGNMTDYFLSEAFFNNTDWPNNNLKFWKSDALEIGYRYILFDMDPTLNNYGWANEYTNHLARVFSEFGETNPHVKILLSLLENENFKNDFLNRYADLINTSFSTQRMLSLFDDFVSLLEPELYYHFDKWGGNSVDYWNNYHLQLAERFLENRPDFARLHIEEVFELSGDYNLNVQIYPEGAGKLNLNTIVVNEANWSGKYFNSIPISLSAIPENDFQFSHFELSTGEKIMQEVVSLVSSEDLDVIAVFKSQDTESVYIYPSPANENVTVSCFLEEPSNCEMNVFDQLGRAVYCLSFENSPSGVFRQSINVSEWNEGLYYVQINTKNTISKSRFLVVH